MSKSGRNLFMALVLLFLCAPPIAVLSALLAVSVAFPLAYFLWRHKVWYAQVLFTLGVAPFMLPPVITALGFLLFWVNVGLYGNINATIISHAIFFVTLPLVTI